MSQGPPAPLLRWQERLCPLHIAPSPPACSPSLWHAAKLQVCSWPHNCLLNRCASPGVPCSSLAEVYMYHFSARAAMIRQDCKAHEKWHISECNCSVVCDGAPSVFHQAGTSPCSLGRSLSFIATSKGTGWGEMFILPALSPYTLHQFFSLFKFWGFFLCYFKRKVLKGRRN